jgi:hypothetical protein
LEYVHCNYLITTKETKGQKVLWKNIYDILFCFLLTLLWFKIFFFVITLKFFGFQKREVRERFKGYRLTIRFP